MKAISIKQPWAFAILHLGKDVENRSWRTHYRGPVLIHASQKIDKEAIRLLKSQGFELPDTFETGGIVGRVEITDCQFETDSFWQFSKQWGWSLANASPMPFVPMKGKLSFFETNLGDSSMMTASAPQERPLT